MRSLRRSARILAAVAVLKSNPTGEYIMKIRKSHKIISCLLAAVLVLSVALCAVSSVMLIRYKRFVANGEHTYAVVSHREEGADGVFYYVLSYYADSERIETPYKQADEDTYPGEDVEIYYSTQNPSQYIPAGNKLMKSLLAVGIILTLCSAAAMCVILVPYILADRLIKSGKWAMCRVTKVKRDGRLYVIYCDSSKFRSRKGKPFRSMGVEKEKLPKNIRESSMTVYYNEKNPNSYYVDIRNL